MVCEGCIHGGCHLLIIALASRQRFVDLIGSSGNGIPDIRQGFFDFFQCLVVLFRKLLCLIQHICRRCQQIVSRACQRREGIQRAC